MGEVDESIITASENNIIVDGIKHFPDSPHDVNKKAFIFRMGKGIEKWYKSRLGFNMFKLPESEYVHFSDWLFPISHGWDHNECRFNFIEHRGQQSTKLFTKYSRSIVYLHIMGYYSSRMHLIDMRCQEGCKQISSGCW